MEWLVIKAVLKGWLKSAWALLAKIPWQVYAVIAALLVLWGAWHWHGVKVREADRAGYARAKEEVRAKAEKLAAAVLQLRLKTEGLQQKINEGVRFDVVQKLNDNRRHADALSVRVPEALRVTCPAGNPGVPGSASGASSTAAGADLSGLAVLPWQPLVRRGESCDRYRVQVDGWNDWYDHHVAAWDQWRKDYDKALAGAAK